MVEPKRHRKHTLRNLTIATTLLSLVLLFAWSPVNLRWLHLPVDFGLLTAVCLILLVLLVYNFVQFLRHAKRSKTKLHYHLIVFIFTLVTFLGFGYFEFRHQFVQILVTPSVRKVSGVPTALGQCDRIGANLFAPTRSGYVIWGSPVAHIHPNACAGIFNWYVWQGKTNTTNRQIHQLDMITHEAVHIGGEESELKTKCASTEWLEEILLDWGVNADEASRIAKHNRETLNNYQQDGLNITDKQYEGNCDELPRHRQD